MTLLYIDTNIFLNVINSEINPYGKDIAAPAGKLLYDALSCKYILLVSTWTIKEMLKKIPVEKVKMTFVLLKDKIKRCEYNQDDVSLAEKRSKDNFPDALHIVIAEKMKADFIVTRNISDFLAIGTNIPIRVPESL